MTTTVSEFKSRFGYHPCDVETFKKLKFLKKMYWKTVKDLHNWFRWNRKTVYKTNNEPKYCDVFVSNKSSYITFPASKNFPNGRSEWREKTLVDHDILSLFELARFPSKSPVNIFDETAIKNINDLYEKVVEQS